MHCIMKKITSVCFFFFTLSSRNRFYFLQSIINVILALSVDIINIKSNYYMNCNITFKYWANRLLLNSSFDGGGRVVVARVCARVP